MPLYNPAQAGGSTPGAVRVIGPWTIYGLQQQTIAFTTSPRAATGDFTFGVNPSDGDPMPAINGFTGIVFKDTPGAFPEIQIEVDLATTLATLASQLDANKGGVGNEALADLTFTADATHLLIAQTTAGAAGNATTLGASTANIVRSGATLTGGSDGGDCTYVFNGQETSALAFDAVAADYQAAFEVLSSVGAGKVVATGSPGAINLVFDDSIVPTLITTGTNNLTNGPDPAAVSIYILAGDRGIELYTPAVNDRILDCQIERVEAMSAGTLFLADAIDGNGDWTSIGFDLTQLDTGTNFTWNDVSASPSLAARSVGVGTFPPRSITGSPLYAVLGSIGGSGNTTGIVKVWLVVSKEK